MGHIDRTGHRRSSRKQANMRESAQGRVKRAVPKRHNSSGGGD
jgi:hypothetical protein